MSKSSDKKYISKTLQFRATNDVCELIDIILNEANLKVKKVGGSQKFNNSDILKLAIQGLVKDRTYIEIAGEQFYINELMQSVFGKFEGKFSDIINKDKLKKILKTGVVKFIGEEIPIWIDQIDNIGQDEPLMVSEVNDIVDRYTPEEESSCEKMWWSTAFDNVIDNFYTNNINESRILNIFNDDRLSVNDEKECFKSSYIKYHISEEEIEFASKISDETLKEDLISIHEYLKSYLKKEDIVDEIKDYLQECILNLDEFYGINAYKVKDSYKQIRHMTILKSIINSYVELLLVK